jgi:hypothetical protein
MLQKSLKVAKLSPKEHVPKRFYTGSEVPKFIAYKVMIICSIMWSIMKDNAHCIRRQEKHDLMCFLILLNATRISGAQLGPAPLSPLVFDLFP